MTCAATYYEKIDEEQVAKQTLRLLAIRRTRFGSSPTWTRGYRLFWGSGWLRWHWKICEGWHGRVVARGCAWTLGGVYRKALEAQRR